ncbi:MAG: hypothetical protein BroJett031_00530 [Betaproteobacteria bacterium]|nr:MAG: hypothetical protein BroJett031_00530 [Betaproteobacteria bacterium]
MDSVNSVDRPLRKAVDPEPVARMRTDDQHAQRAGAARMIDGRVREQDLPERRVGEGLVAEQAGATDPPPRNIAASVRLRAEMKLRLLRHDFAVLHHVHRCAVHARDPARLLGGAAQ